MKIFLSWSGDRSKNVATLFFKWIKCVLQTTEPWISTRDIDRGDVWFSAIRDQLQDSNMGIVFLTKENKERPWILFESGALYKGLDQRVCTLLIDLEPSDVKAPLGQFNHTSATQLSMRTLVDTINSRLTDPLEASILDRVFETYWPQFENEFARILATPGASDDAEDKPRTEQDLLSEILDISRSLSKRVALLERLAVVQQPHQMDAVPPWAAAAKPNRATAGLLAGVLSDPAAGISVAPNGSLTPSGLPPTGYAGQDGFFRPGGRPVNPFEPSAKD